MLIQIALEYNAVFRILELKLFYLKKKKIEKENRNVFKTMNKKKIISIF